MAERTLKINADLTDLKVGLKDLATSIDRLSKKMDEMGTRTKTNMTQAAGGVNKIDSEAKELKATLQGLEQDALDFKNKMNAATDPKKVKLFKKEYRETWKEIRRVKGEMKKLGDQGAASMSKVNKQVSLGRQLFLRLRSVMLTVFGAYAIIQGIRNITNAIIDFEKGVARLAAITGETAENIERLAGLSRAISTEGIFNANEILEVQTQLAKFGFTLSEIESSTRSIVNFAIATGEDLSTSAELVSSTIRSLGLSAGDAAMVVDVLGKSFVSSALDLNKFKESAKFLLPLAKQLGWSLIDVTAVLGKLADRGISASLAGTGLRQIMIQLLDSSSDMSEVLGVGIRSLDDLYAAIDKAKEEGVSFEEFLDAIPQRAKTLGSALWATTDAVKAYREELRESGTVNEMAAIQMDTLSAKIDQFNASWKAMVTSIQSSGGVVADFVERMAEAARDWARIFDPGGFELAEAGRRFDEFNQSISLLDAPEQIGKLNDKMKELDKTMTSQKEVIDGYKRGLEELADPNTFIPGRSQRISATEALLNDAEALYDGLWNEWKMYFDRVENLEISELFNKQKTAIIKSTSELQKEGMSELEAFTASYFKAIEGLQTSIVNGVPNKAVYYGAINRLSEYYEQQFARLKALEEQNLADSEARWKKYIENQRRLLSLEEKLFLERNDNIVQSEEDRELEILAIRYDYAKKNLELDLLSGELTEDQAIIVNQLLLELEETFQREKFEVREKYNDKYKDLFAAEFEEQLKLMKTNHEIELQELKNNGATKEELWEAEMKYLIRIAELRLQLNQLLGNDTRQLMADLQLLKAEFAGGFQETDETIDNTKKIAQAYKRLASEVIDALESMADARVETTSQLVDDLDTRIAETQRALETETQLYIEGYANNVTLKKKELSDLKEARDQAIVDREKAVRRQQQLEAIAQAIDLASAVASTIKIYSKIPGVGLAIAAVVAGGFLALFSAMQAKSKTISQYGEGGEVDGDSHARGGVLIEAEGGEFVMRKSAYAKYPELVRAINEDNLPEFNASVMNNIGGGSDVIIDNEIWHKMYSLWDKNLNKGKVEIVGKKKIVTRGIRKRTINV